MSPHVGDGDTGHDDQAAHHVTLCPGLDGETLGVGRLPYVQGHFGRIAAVGISVYAPGSPRPMMRWRGAAES